MWSSIVSVFAVALLISHNGVSGRLKCNNGTFHDTSSPGITGCKPCSTCQGRKVMSACRKTKDTVCCQRRCPSDSYLDESACVCRQCTRTCPANYRMRVSCGERNNAQCVPVGGHTEPKQARASQPDRTPAGKTDQTPASTTVGHRHTTPVYINTDAVSTPPTAALPPAAVGKSQTPPRPHQTSSELVTRSVSTSRATSPPPPGRGTRLESTAGVMSGSLIRPLRIITFVLGGIVVVTVASLLLYCKLTMTCRLKSRPTRGVPNDHHWRMQPPLNNLYADRLSVRSPADDRSKEPSPEARSPFSGVPDSTSIGSFGPSSSSTATDREEIAIRVAEWECEPYTAVGESPAPAAGKASGGRGDNARFYPSNMSMNNVFPEMSPAPSKVWIDENGQSKVYHGHYVNGGAHCSCHHHNHHHNHPEYEQQQVCHQTTCMHDDYFMSTFSIGSLGSSCTV